jgi:hypothetical protein
LLLTPVFRLADGAGIRNRPCAAALACRHPAQGQAVSVQARARLLSIPAIGENREPDAGRLEEPQFQKRGTGYRVSRAGAGGTSVGQQRAEAPASVEERRCEDASCAVQAAIVATRYNPDIKALYERLCAKGKAKMTALGAAMRKLVHLCFAVLKNQQNYRQNVPQIA